MLMLFLINNTPLSNGVVQASELYKYGCITQLWTGINGSLNNTSQICAYTLAHIQKPYKNPDPIKS